MYILKVISHKSMCFVSSLYIFFFIIFFCIDSFVENYDSIGSVYSKLEIFELSFGTLRQALTHKN